MRLPQDEFDGSFPKAHVLDVLSAHGVEITLQKGTWMYELVYEEGDIFEAYMLPDIICRDLLQVLCRKFEIAITEFIGFKETKH